MQTFFDSIISLLPSGVDLYTFGKFLLILAGATLLTGIVGKLLFGVGSQLNRCLCGAVGILFVYALAMFIHTFQPGTLSNYLTSLPLVSFSGGTMYLFRFGASGLSVCCREVLSLWILAYLYHILDEFFPRGKKLYWMVYRMLTISMALVLHYILLYFLRTYVPADILSSTTTIVLLLLIGLFALGIAKVVLGVLLTITNPILGALYLFFFGSKSGKQLSRAFLTAAILCVLVAILGYLGYGAIPIHPDALLAYAPFAGILLLLWYIVGYKL